MAKTSTGFLKSLDDRVEGILNACTACGDCVSVFALRRKALASTSQIHNALHRVFLISYAITAGA